MLSSAWLLREEAVVIPFSLLEVLSFHRLIWYWGHKFFSSDERGSMLRLKELLKHPSGCLLSGLALAKARSILVLEFQCLVVKLTTPFGLWSRIKLLFAAHSTKHSPLDVLALYPHFTCWQLKSPAYTHGNGSTGRYVFKRREDGGL